jgi:hypothetical protein
MMPVFGDRGVQVGVNADDSRKKSFSLLILDLSIDDSVCHSLNQSA